MENLQMIRGDTLAFGFELDGVTSVDAVYFSIKKTMFDADYVVQKSLNDGIVKIEDGKYSVRVAPSDTYNLEVGTYYYDLQIDANGDVFTVLNGVLEIEADITREIVNGDVIKAGSYYLKLLQSGNTILEVISFALDSDSAVVILFTNATTSTTFATTYSRNNNKITLTIGGLDYELKIKGSALYYNDTPLTYKPNFDVDYINEVFEEDNNG